MIAEEKPGKLAKWEKLVKGGTSAMVDTYLPGTNTITQTEYEALCCGIATQEFYANILKELNKKSQDLLAKYTAMPTYSGEVAYLKAYHCPELNRYLTLETSTHFGDFYACLTGRDVYIPLISLMRAHFVDIKGKPKPLTKITGCSLRVV